MADSNIVHKLYGEHLGNSHVSKFIGHRGDIFYDPDVGELRLGDSHTQQEVKIDIMWNARIFYADTPMLEPNDR